MKFSNKKKSFLFFFNWSQQDGSVGKGVYCQAWQPDNPQKPHSRREPTPASQPPILKPMILHQILRPWHTCTQAHLHIHAQTQTPSPKDIYTYTHRHRHAQIHKCWFFFLNEFPRGDNNRAMWGLTEHFLPCLDIRRRHSQLGWEGMVWGEDEVQ